VRSCGKCAGCVQPTDIEITSKALGILCDYAGGYITLSLDTLIRLTERAELDRWVYEVLLWQWAHGPCVKLILDQQQRK
jgi:hypothetical protein